MFTEAERDRVRKRVLELAGTDSRVVAGAEVGSLAADAGDRWSDLDLTFALREGLSAGEVLADWTLVLSEELDAVPLFDLPSGRTVYRVFLLPGCLQLDISFTPAEAFGAAGPKWRLLFGRDVERPHAGPPTHEELFGYAVHHARAARVAIERSRPWLAEYWLSALRDYALSLACRQRDLPARYGRGFDDLPAGVLARFEPAVVRSLDREELERALRACIAALRSESGDLATRVEQQLRELAGP